MLSTQVIQNVGSASHYFLGQDNYYTQDHSLAQEHSQWFGRGASILGLSGAVESETFTQLLAGKLPSGQQLGKVCAGQIQHRPGFDLTFSAPKSVSLLALLGGDTRILSAVERATTCVLNRLEQDLATARITQSGNISYQSTQNLVIARFLHDISRAGDPQLHTHCVVMNMTQRADGEWRSLASQSGVYGAKATLFPQGFFEAVRHHKKYYGALFRAELAYEMQQLGYEISPKPQGFFEIEGISGATLQAFSQRRQAIEHFLEQQGLSGAKDAALATLKTRAPKSDLNREALLAHWHLQAEQSTELGLTDVDRVIQQAQKIQNAQDKSSIPDPSLSDPHAIARAEKALTDAIAHLSDTQTILRKSAILHTALQYTLSAPVSTEVLFHTFKTWQQNGTLLAVENPSPILHAHARAEPCFTTAELRQEQNRLNAAQSPHPRHHPWVDANTVDRYLNTRTDDLLPETVQAIQTLCASTSVLWYTFPDAETRHHQMATEYANLPPAQRQQTHVILPTRAQCEAMNAAIRQALLQQGALSAESASITTLQPQRLSATAQRYAVHYQIGQWIRFDTHSLSLRVCQGGYRQVVGLDAKSNTIQLAHPKNPDRVVHWNPARVAVGKIRVFTPKVREIAVGEYVIWRHTDKAPGLRAGRVFRVERMTPKHIHLYALDEQNSQPKLRLNRTQLSHTHFEYAYATLPKQTRLQSCNLVMWDAVDSNKPILHQAKRLDPEFQPTTTATAPWSDSDSAPLSALRHAIEHLSEREAAFSSRDLIQSALQHALGAVNVTQLEQALQQAEAQGALVRGGDSNEGIRWTTPAALAQERALLQLARSHAESESPWFSAAAVTQYLAQQTPTLSREQSDTVQQLATIRSGLVLIQGYAGTRKTSLLQHIQKLLQSHSEQIAEQSSPSSESLLCLTPTHTAAQECRARGLSAQTLDSFLNSPQRHTSQTPSLLLVVDESSMVSTQKMLQLLQLIQHTKTRVLLLGDVQQYPAIEAGKPFALLQQAEITTLHLTDITRQTNPELKALVAATYQRDFAGVLQKLGDSAIEIANENGSRHARLVAIQHDYLSRAPTRRAQTAIITFGNAERIEQNTLIRTALKAEGTLSGRAYATAILVPKSLSRAEQQVISHYQCGDVVRFESTALNAHPNRYWQVQSIDVKNNVLSLACYGNVDTTQPAPMLWRPGSAGVEIYQIQNREIQQGDLIRFTHSQAPLKIFSADLAQVTQVSPEAITLRRITLTGREPETRNSLITLHPQQARCQHWDHAYAMTAYSAQGKTIREVIIHAESHRPQLTNQPSFLVALTRAVEAVTLYTDNKTALIQALETHTGMKTSAIESLGLQPKSIPSNLNHPSNPALEKGIELEL